MNTLFILTPHRLFSQSIFHMKTFLTTLMLLPLLAGAQSLQQKRIEFELKDGFSNEEIHSFGTDGFIVSSRNEDSKGGEVDWRYELYNTEMEAVKVKNVPINKKFRDVSSYKSDFGLHTLYLRKSEYTMVSVEPKALDVKSVDGKLPPKCILGDMQVLGDRAYFPATMKKKRFVYSINWKTGKSNLIPVIISNFSAKKTFIERIQVLKESDELLVFVSVLVKKKKSELYVMRINSKGEKTDVWHVSQKFTENIVDISGSKIADDEYVFTGTYSRSGVSMAEGLFFCRYGSGKLDLIKFYSFVDMKNFLSYMSDKTLKRLEKKKAKKASKGKELSISYRIADHPVIQADGDFFFLGEAFYPTYRTETYTETRVVNGVTQTVTRTRQVFDGYQYTHAVLARFDKKGKMVWEKSFEMWPTYKPFFVKRFIQVADKSEDGINLVFASHSRIVSKSFGFDGSVQTDRKSEPIQTGKEGDKTRHSFSNIDYWYDRSFLAYGLQTIKNKEDKSVKRKRKVYFISKVDF